MTNYEYPELFENLDRKINHWAQLKAETGADGVAEKMAEINSLIAEKLAELRALPDDPVLRAAEPDDLAGIRELRPAGARRYWTELPQAIYRDRLEGAMLGRFAGNILGSIVELWDIEKMERWAAYLGDTFPPVDYWSQAERPFEFKYQTSRRDRFTRSKMDGVPTDDDIIYTQLGMLILEDYGPDFSVDDVGAAWVKYLPVSPASPVLGNLQAGVPPMQAAEVDNPTMFWIIGDIRSDPWGYAAPGYPEKAAEFAWRDATVSSRRNGIYGEMYISAVISAAFALGDPLKAIEVGLEEIPAGLRAGARNTLGIGQSGRHQRLSRGARGRRRPLRRHARCSYHQQCCADHLGLNIGGTDYTKLIGETVAMGLDNDCTAATAGSIFGAAYGVDAIPKHWTRNFNNKVYSYIIGVESFALDDMLDRFTALAQVIVTV